MQLYYPTDGESIMIIDFVPLWTILLGAAVFFFYVLLDGFDLGVGMLYGLAPDSATRNLIMNSIAPIWDGNTETWFGVWWSWLACSFSASLRNYHSRCLFSYSG